MVDQNPFVERLQRSVAFVQLALLPFLTLLFMIFFLYELRPLFYSDRVLLNELRQSSEYQELRERMAKQVMTRSIRPVTLIVPLSTLVDGKVTLPRTGLGEVGFDLENGEASLRVDRFILFGGIFMMIVLTGYVTVARSAQARVRSEPALRARGRQDGDQSSALNGTIAVALAREVDLAHDRATDMYSRSTLLLAGGIVMAFIGVGIFYVTLPESPKVEPLAGYLPTIIRPIGVLVFVEAIAWFLLRQYRALIEDYKWFHRVYLKRANYLAAYKLIEAGEVTPEALFLAANLLDEDLSGRLGQGESTEALEAQKLVEPNPILGILEKIIAAKWGRS